MILADHVAELFRPQLVGERTRRIAVEAGGGKQAGVAGAIASTSRQIGASLGVAITGSLIAGSQTGFISGSHAAWAVITGCGVAVLLLGIGSTGTWAKQTAEVTRLLLLDNPKEVSDGTLTAVG